MPDLFGPPEMIMGIVIHSQAEANMRGMSLMLSPALMRFVLIDAPDRINLGRWLYPAKPMACPHCGGEHIDTRFYAHRPHSTHSCQHCGEKFEGELAYGAKEQRPALDMVICKQGTARPVLDNLKTQCQKAGIDLYVEDANAGEQ